MHTWTAAELESCEWFRELQQLIQAELDRITGDHGDRQPALEMEIRRHQEQQRGWSQSLSKTDLPPTVRATIERDLQVSLELEAALQDRLQRGDLLREQRRRFATAELVAERLNRLADVLAHNDPTRGNLELALHIESILCNPDGRVVVRTCKLGALAGAAEFFMSNNGGSMNKQKIPPETVSTMPRRLSRRRFHPDDVDSEGTADAAEFATDPNRFGELGPDWFWDDVLQLPGPPECWAEANALNVAAKRIEGLTHEELAVYFDKSVPTIRKALRYAARKEPTISHMPRKMPRARWQNDHYEEVWELAKQGLSVRRISEQFGKSEPLIRAALVIAEKKFGDPPASFK